MAHVPVVSCDFPEIKKVVEEEKIGIAINANNTDAIAEAVNSMVNNESLRDEYSKNCRLAKTKYNWNIEQQKLLEIYRNL